MSMPEFPSTAQNGMTLAPNVHIPQVLALDTAARNAIDPQEIQEAREQVESQGRSFSALEYIEDNYGAKRAEAVTTDMDNGGVQIGLMHDALPFLNRVDSGKAPRFVMSSTNHIEGQYSKIISSPYIGGVMLTPDSDKGTYQKTFHYDDGYHFYRIGTPLYQRYIAEEVYLVDDNPVTFENWTGPGFCVLRGKSLKRALSPNIRPIQTLDELTVIEGRVVHVDDVQTIKQIANVALSRPDIIVPVLNPRDPNSKRVWVGETL